MSDEDISYDLDDVFDAFPQLRAVAPFVAIASDMPWFRSLAEPLANDVREAAHALVEGLGFPEAFPAVAGEWEDAAAALETLDYNSPAWEAEEMERARLTGLLVEGLGEEVFELVMTHIAQAISEPVALAAEEAQEFLRIDDEAFMPAITGAAAQACHQAVLVLLAAGMDSLHGDPDEPPVDTDTHPFMLRFRLFERGRWPLGITGNSFNIF